VELGRGNLFESHKDDPTTVGTLFFPQLDEIGEAGHVETSCGGIKLQICRKMLNSDLVGLIVFFFIPDLWQDLNINPTLFLQNLWGWL
jgi:hypothetical protein